MAGHVVPPIIVEEDSSPQLQEIKAYQMLSWYCYFEKKLDDDNVEALVSSLRSTWTPLGILGRTYVANEGINAQLAVPVETMSIYSNEHTQLFERLQKMNNTKLAQPENSLVPPLNLDAQVSYDEFLKQPPFKALHLRIREKIVTDQVHAPNLDLRDAGRDISPLEWHESLPNANIILDVRNHYESAVGSFNNATPLNTETFKDTNYKLDNILKNKPRDEPVFMFCTGGIRCVKAGAYVKQQLGFSDVRRLQGGIVNYTTTLKKENKAIDQVSHFRGVNFVFNDRMGESITRDLPQLNDKKNTTQQQEFDTRAAEALVNSARQEKDTNYELYQYAEKLSGEEYGVLKKARLDAMARFPHAAHMLCGPIQGKFLKMLCQISGAKRVLELGTFCGYGSLWLASALGKDGQVITVDRDTRAAEIAQTHFNAASTHHPDWAKIHLIISDTGEFLSLQNLQSYEPFDLVVLDADKKGYAAAVDSLFQAHLLRTGSILVADNTLWKGAVLGFDKAGASFSSEHWIQREQIAREEARHFALSQGTDPDLAEREAKQSVKSERRDRALLQAMHEFNIKIRKHPRLDQLLLPLRDGLTVARVIDDPSSS